jgi:hypothetical protein
MIVGGVEILNETLANFVMAVAIVDSARAAVTVVLFARIMVRPLFVLTYPRRFRRGWHCCRCSCRRPLFVLIHPRRFRCGWHR